MAVAYTALIEARAFQETACPGGDAADARGREELGDAATLLGAGGVDEPHEQEERHHGGDEVRVRHFPRAAMVAAAAAFFYLFDDDGALIGRRGHVRSDPTCVSAREARYNRQTGLKTGVRRVTFQHGVS